MTFTQSSSSQQQLEHNKLIEERADNLDNELKDSNHNGLKDITGGGSEQSLEEHQQLTVTKDNIAIVQDNNPISKSDADILSFEFSLPYKKLQNHMALFKKKGSSGKVWFSGKINKNTGDLISSKIGSLNQQNVAEKSGIHDTANIDTAGKQENGQNPF